MSGSWYQVLSQDALLPAEEAGKGTIEEEGFKQKRIWLN